MSRAVMRVLPLFLGLFMLLAAAPGARAESDAQQLVTKAQWSLNAMLSDPDFSSLARTLPEARAVMIFPSILKAAFIFGAEGGNGVLLVRGAGGDWSYPAFYTLGAASFGLQIGGEEQEVVLLIMNDAALDAIIRAEVKLGADLSVAVGPVGAGIEGSTTTAVGGDIVAYSRSQGLFAGVSVEGAVIHEREGFAQEYYGTSASVNQIVIERTVSNGGADQLRGTLAGH